MELKEKLDIIYENQQEVFEAGKQAEYDRFWDGYQDNGNRTNYDDAFIDKYWTDEIFNPKYDLILTQCSRMFQYSGITKLASKLKERGLKFDTSGFSGSNEIEMFLGSRVRDVPELDLRTCRNIGYLFFGSKVETVEKLILSEKAIMGLNTVFYAKQLRHIIFDGVLASTGLNMKDCTLLDKESIVSLINILSTTKSGLTVTLSLQAVNKAFETSEGANDGSNSTEWQTLIGTKTNWTINLS